LKILFLVGCGGFLGAILRVLITTYSFKAFGSNFPYGTMIVNVLGGFLIGVFMSVAVKLSPELRSFLIPGFLGGLTTFSTFSYENLEMMMKGDLALAFVNIFLSVGLALLACYLGMLIFRQF